MPSPQPHLPSGPPVHADIFCRVIDNFGDIGVCWRLARRLAHGHGWRVRLWVDDLDSFARLAPGVAAGRFDGLEIVHWTTDAPALTPGDVVIEAFACDPPAAYRSLLTSRHVWLNLEYLTAEPWAQECHDLPSPQPGGAVKRFFFPGFVAGTGGLLREPGLLGARDAFQADAAARAAFLERIGLTPAQARAVARGDTDFYPVFCYPDAPLPAWRAALVQAGRPALVALAGGSGAAWPDVDGPVRCLRLPFLSHDDFDRLLWAGTINVVRGEDSFVRAQWAGRPMLWHIYPQDDAAHLVKLAAWLERAAPPPAACVLNTAWNTADDAALQAAWSQIHRDAWAARMRDWSTSLAHDVPELADSIANVTRDRLEC